MTMRSRLPETIGKDPYFKLCFDHVDPIDDTFASIALDVFEPLMRNRDKMDKLKR